MAKVDTIVSSLQKLYLKRSTLDKQIAENEKKLLAEAKAAAKPAATAKKSAAKKTAGRKPGVRKTAPKPTDKPSLKK